MVRQLHGDDKFEKSPIMKHNTKPAAWEDAAQFFKSDPINIHAPPLPTAGTRRVLPPPPPPISECDHDHDYHEHVHSDASASRMRETSGNRSKDRESEVKCFGNSALIDLSECFVYCRRRALLRFPVMLAEITRKCPKEPLQNRTLLRFLCPKPSRVLFLQHFSSNFKSSTKVVQQQEHHECSPETAKA
ncbi:hypothetical protein OSTOST_13994 [Ostertagia ostertagi]